MAFRLVSLGPDNLHSTARRVRASLPVLAPVLLCLDGLRIGILLGTSTALRLARGAREFRTIGACRLAQTSRRPTRTLPETQMLA